MYRDCIEWEGRRNAGGYGTKYHNGKPWLVNRLEWPSANGPIPKGMNVCHKCDNPACYKLSHLFLGTQKDNVRDMHRKGRQSDTSGFMHPQCKLVKEDIIKIKKLLREGMLTQRRIAALFNITKTHVYHIKVGNCWKEVEEVVMGADYEEDDWHKYYSDGQQVS